MAEDVFKTNYTHFRSKVKERWPSLTDHDLDEINGDRSVLVAMLVQTYYDAIPGAKAEVNMFIRENMPN